MFDFQNIKGEITDRVLTITLNRVHKRNAIDELMMDELIEAFGSISRLNVIAVILRAQGDDFCAGADLNWMLDSQKMDEASLTHQNLKLHKCFQLWYDLPVFTICVVHGNVLGGGIGLMAASDLVIAAPSSRFRFPEVTLGLIPALVSSFVLQRASGQFIRNAMLTARPFNSHDALNIGLVDYLAEPAAEEDIIHDYIEFIRQVEPNALKECKKLIIDINHNKINEPMDLYSARLLTRVRKSEHAQRRIEEFFTSLKNRNEN